MSEGNNVDKMTDEQKLAYVHAYLRDAIDEHQFDNPQLEAGLKVLKEQLEKPAEPGVDMAKAVDTLAKNLPNVSKGIISATAAFKSGDNVTGAAEIMNICSALAPIIGGFTAAGGPAGMLVGALFSVIGQIIALFAPPKESDVDKIKKFLLSIEAEGIKEHADADLKSIRNAAKGMRHQAAAAEAALKARKLLTHQDALNFQAAISIETISIAEFKLIDGPTVLQHWGVASWLTNPNRYDQDEWPEIFGMFCQAYADLLCAYIKIIAFANGADMRAAFDDVRPHNPALKLEETDRHDIEQALLRLTEYADKRLDDIRNCNELMSDILEKLTPVARKRGMFVTSQRAWDIVWGSGPKAFRGTWGSSFWASTSRMFISVPSGGLTDLRALYDLWVLDTRGPKVGHARIDAEKHELQAGSNAYHGDANGFNDITALANPKDKAETLVYVATDKGVSEFSFRQNTLTRAGWRSDIGAVKQVRAAQPASPLANDPDRDAMTVFMKGNDRLVYVALNDGRIWVHPADKYVANPWGSVPIGIATDPYYLWLFQPRGFACASHASIQQCISGKRAQPNWLGEINLDYLLYDGNQYPGNRQERDGTIPPHPGLIDLSPCGDDTLFISLTTRKVEKEEIPYQGNLYSAVDHNAVYTAVYHADFAASAIRVEPYDEGMNTPWQKLEGNADVKQVQKLPIFCWPLLEGLKAACVNNAWKAGGPT